MRALSERTGGIRTKAAIRQEALRLFLRNGFQETTLDDIAQVTAVSPGDLLKLYPSKTAMLMQDDLDLWVLAAFRAQPPGINPVAAFRNALRSVLSDVRPEQSVIVRQRALVIRQDAELRAALLTQFGGMVDRVAEVVAARVGPGPTTLAVRDLAGALVSLVMSITLSASGEPLAELIKQSDEALDRLEAGLSLAAVDGDDDPPETHLLRLRDGRRLAYTEWGDRGGDPIIFHHGTPGSRLDHEAAQSLYRSLKLRVITPDRPGYGLSDNKPRRQLVEWPSDVIELADSLDIPRFGVVSLSGGGLYAIACAALIPDRLLSVVTTGSPAPFDHPGAVAGMQLTHRAGLWLEETLPLIFAGGVKLVGSLIQRHPDYFIDDLTRNSPAADQQVLSTPWVRSSVMATLLEAVRGGSTGYDDDLRILTSAWGFPLEEIRVPVHVWHGEVDAVVPLHQARYLAETIPGADLTICPGEAHMLLWNHLPEILAIATAGRQYRAHAELKEDA